MNSAATGMKLIPLQSRRRVPHEFLVFHCNYFPANFTRRAFRFCFIAYFVSYECFIAIVCISLKQISCKIIISLGREKEREEGGRRRERKRPMMYSNCPLSLRQSVNEIFDGCFIFLHVIVPRRQQSCVPYCSRGQLTPVGRKYPVAMSSIIIMWTRRGNEIMQRAFIV